MRASFPGAALAGAALAALWLTGCGGDAGPPPGAVAGDPEAGRTLIGRLECGTCHSIPGVTGARGIVGPPLDGFGRRAYIAGILPNRADTLAHWVRAAPELAPATAMPAMPIDERAAQDIAAYLHTLR